MPKNLARLSLVCAAALVLGLTFPQAWAAPAKKGGGPARPAAAATPEPVPREEAEAEAREPKGVQTPLEQLRVLRQQVEKQEVQIGELRSALEELRSVARVREAEPPAKSTPSAAAPAPLVNTPAPEVAAATPPAEPTRVERAEPVPTGPQHTVAKGETLTSIAKHYNITIVELQKANKVVDDRKLQIGQVLSIPSAKTTESPTEKKDTP